MRSSEVTTLIIAILRRLVGGLLGGLAILAQRWVKNEPVWAGRRERITSPTMFYGGIVCFGGMSAVAFASRVPLFGISLLGASALYLLGLIAFKRGWRG